MKDFLKAVVRLDFKTLFKQRTTNSFIQFFRYVFVGGFAFLADAFVLWLCERWTNYMIAAAVAFVVGLVVNYILSTWFVFSESGQFKSKTKEFIGYAIIGVIGLGLTEVIMYALTDVLHIYFMFSKVVAAAIVLIWNFAARKKILYRNK